ncbi:hypothetical protein KVF89_08965 [Nocardioides carbamazepini]|uniref:DUF7657 domain-containing protein n=1 Tax=Nocardioides carbamazepini TaxID=2854259 RepID=UPI002149D25B|nr:hypothetical protein [Nocardioides carbamazepini]MCR1782660.1 hypothetical protein [Nocardioides carbamazepini]
MAAFVLLCLLGTTTSSLGAFRVDAERPADGTIGQPQSVRADEFMTETTINLGWITAGGRGIDNPLSVEPNFLTQLPSGPVSAIVFFDGTVAMLGPWLPDDMLFAGRWWLPALLLALGLPAWFRQLTGSRRWGVLATVLIFFSPANAWWSGRPINTLGFMFAGAALLLGGWRDLEHGRRARGFGQLVLAAILIARFPSYYQPFAIVLGFPVLIATVVFMLRQGGPLRTKLVAIGVTGVLSGALTALTMLENLTALRSTLGTVYPGQRVSTGEAQTFGKVFGAPVLGFLEKVQGTAVDTNATEASSSFVVLFLVAVLVWLGTRRRRPGASVEPSTPSEAPGVRAAWLVWMVATLVWLSWCSIDFGSVGEHLPLLNLVPAIRAANVSGFLAIVAFCLLMSQVREGGRWLALSAGGGAGVVTALAGWSWHDNGLPDLRPWMIWISAVVTALVIFVVVRWPRHPAAMSALGLAAVLVGVFVNPIQIGLGDLRGSRAATVMIDAGRDARADDELWASDTPSFDALMFATATPALSARQQLGPNDAAWRVLDPGGAHEDTWNRGGTYVRFVWTDAPSISWQNPTIDQIIMSGSPCAVADLEPRLRHVASSIPLDAACLELDREVQWDGLRYWLYTVDDQ